MEIMARLRSKAFPWSRCRLIVSFRSLWSRTLSSRIPVFPYAVFPFQMILRRKNALKKSTIVTTA
jgi:hypothetical protein